MILSCSVGTVLYYWRLQYKINILLFLLTGTCYCKKWTPAVCLVSILSCFSCIIWCTISWVSSDMYFFIFSFVLVAFNVMVYQTNNMTLYIYMLLVFYRNTKYVPALYIYLVNISNVCAYFFILCTNIV